MNRVKNYPRLIRPSLLIFLALVALTLAIKFIIVPKLSTYEICYNLSINDVSDMTLKANIRIKPNSKLFGFKTYQFEKADVLIAQPKCNDNLGNNINFEYKDGVISIGPLNPKSHYVDFSYITQLNGSGDLGTKGMLLDDLLVFAGEDVLIFPYFESQNSKYNVQSYISKVSVETDFNKNWQAIMPYQNSSESESQNQISIKAPRWSTFYNLSKSCYTFGNFIKKDIICKYGNIKVCIDSNIKEDISADAIEAIGSLYDFYAGKFNGGIENYPITLLRKDRINNSSLAGGVSAKTMGLTFDEKDPERYKTLSHMMYTAFFDNKVDIQDLHYPPNLWLYKGLAAYYETISLDVLPEEVRNKYALKAEDRFNEMYTQYLYFTYKEPGFFKMSPAEEQSSLLGQQKFYFYIKSPLVVKLIGDITKKNHGNSDLLLENLIEHSGREGFRISSIMLDTLGTQEELIRSCLAGNTLIPFSRKNVLGEDSDEVIKILDSYEKYISGIIKRENTDYPEDKILLLNEKKVLQEADNRGLTFGSEAEEKQVKEFSPTVYTLIKQYLLRADICGEKDLNDPLVKFKLINNNDNLVKWNEFSSNLEE